MRKGSPAGAKIYKKRERSDDPWLSSVLALRLRQIERTYPSQEEFVKASRLSRSTLLLLRYGRGNPSLKTLTTLADSFGVSVWSLLGIREESVKGDVESFGLPYDDIFELLNKEIGADTPAPQSSRKQEAGSKRRR
jgi:transcriptional regulator with XRE-family HTH domain